MEKMIIRKPAVAGQFYPAQPGRLSRVLQTMLANADAQGKPVPKAIIAPHAGYIYSGSVAACAYARLLPAANIIKRVVLLGPCHRVGVMGLALPESDQFETPLGRITLDSEAIDTISKFPQVIRFDDTHQQEHSLEVHLPFLQEVIEEFSLVPLVVGQATAADVAEVLDKLWGGPETLIVISSDLSHYLNYDDARRKDAETCQSIETLSWENIDHHGACGRYPMGGLLQIAKRRGMQIETVDLRNSGDTAGPKDKVVGYGAWVLTESRSQEQVEIESAREKDSATPGVSEEQRFEYATRRILEFHGESLLRVAAKSIVAGLKNGKLAQLRIDHCPLPLINEGASFVTLKKSGVLRGCIGSARAHRPLVEDVFHNAYGAAFNDPRFPALSEDELPLLNLSVSVLSPQVSVSVGSNAQLLKILRPGRDGLVIQDGNRRALFLPAVWEQLPDPEQFLARLKEKAGMDSSHWSDSFRAWRFIAEEYHDSRLDSSSSLWEY